MKEIWKDIPSFEGYYQVSNHGRIKALARTTFDKNGKRVLTSRSQIWLTRLLSVT